eukprot:1136484-Pelagomonas_calceolata.AAC.6
MQLQLATASLGCVHTFNTLNHHFPHCIQLPALLPGLEAHIKGFTDGLVSSPGGLVATLCKAMRLECNVLPVTNMLFRMGAAAVLLSNKSKFWDGRAKYQLCPFAVGFLHFPRNNSSSNMYKDNHRVHLGMNDEAYGAIQYGPDQDGINGIYLVGQGN